MYSYQHRYHAGSFADIQKHVVLLAILTALRQKDAPFCALDAFAGEGVYDLTCAEAQKTQEFRGGYGDNACQAFPYRDLLDQIAASHLAPDNQAPYPGSPALMAAMLRPQDRAIFIENHPQAIEELQKHFKEDPRILIQKKDAYKVLATLLPLRQARGIILIDPSYEVKDEYVWVVDALKTALEKYRQGIFMVWYPLTKEGRHETMTQSIEGLGCPNFWKWEWTPKDPETTAGLYGSGVVVLNLPYHAAEALNPFQS